eukprot:GHVU01160878.1.p2 GENE.GHVU01160878.1~~GHVU01160878.1.p2  ORF type:complete len:110 (+),score=3.57 GHVU01160878.1:519-848(+)
MLFQPPSLYVCRTVTPTRGGPEKVAGGGPLGRTANSCFLHSFIAAKCRRHPSKIGGASSNPAAASASRSSARLPHRSSSSKNAPAYMYVCPIHPSIHLSSTFNHSLFYY